MKMIVKILLANLMAAMLLSMFISPIVGLSFTTIFLMISTVIYEKLWKDEVRRGLERRDLYLNQAQYIGDLEAKVAWYEVEDDTVDDILSRHIKDGILVEPYQELVASLSRVVSRRRKI